MVKKTSNSKKSEIGKCFKVKGYVYILQVLSKIARLLKTAEGPSGAKKAQGPLRVVLIPIYGSNANG